MHVGTVAGKSEMTINDLVETIKGSQQHNYLYHFTDEVNFGSIRAKGLVSKAIMCAEGWWPVAPGGNLLSWQLDFYRGIAEYVSLCLTRNHPMKFIAERDGRLRNTRHLGISPDILRTEGVRVAFGIANAIDVCILPLEQSLDKLDLQVLYTRTNWCDFAIQRRLRAAERIEILMPNAVPLQFIERLW